MAESQAVMAAVGGDAAEAERLARSAFELASLKGPWLDIEDLHLQHAGRLLAAGRLDEASREAQDVREKTRQWGYDRGRARAELVLAEIELVRGNADQTDTWLAQAREASLGLAAMAEHLRVLEARSALLSGRAKDALAAAREVSERAQDRGDVLLVLNAERVQALAMAALAQAEAAAALESETRRRAAELGLEHLID